MPITPLHFYSPRDVCAFIRAINLRNFLLLGKQTILIAHYSEVDIDLARKTYGAEIRATPEIIQVIREYLSETALPILNWLSETMAKSKFTPETKFILFLFVLSSLIILAILRKWI